jgi:Cu/Ag efflux pump CusA
MGRSLNQYASLKVFSTIGTGNTLAYFLVILYSILLVKNKNKTEKILFFMVILGLILNQVKMAIVAILFISLLHFIFFTNLKNKILNLLGASGLALGIYFLFDQLLYY